MLSVGASGAIFGISVAMLVAGIRHKDLVPGDQTKMLGKGAIPFFVYNLVFGLAIPGISVVAHIGGASGGAAAALSRHPARRPPEFEYSGWRLTFPSSF